MPDAPRRPIGDYGLIGDTRTAALVSSDGAIDWLCAPHFDGDPLFGRLVGGRAAGTFRAGPAAVTDPVARRYRPGTATLETVWETGGAQLTLTEGMVAEVSGRLLPTTMLVRRLTSRGGPVDVTIEFDPRFGEARRTPRSARRGRVLVCSRGSLAVALETHPDLDIGAGRPASVTVEPDQPLTMVLAIAHREPLVYVDPDAAWAALEADERRWCTWTEEIDADVPFRDAVVRSLLTLRLLTYSPSGAPVAAPTTSLPEELGGIRNWDYRFTWPRDASIGVGTFLGVGKENEASMFLAWLLHASRLDRPHLPVLLTLHGKHAGPERTLDGWPGYAGSTPVRVGNGAADQHQLDGYGWVLDAAWLLTQAGRSLNSEAWRAIRGFADRVCERWREPDAGIWELRGDAQHHIHSKLMAWLALDRALRIAETHRFSKRRRRRWHAEREAIAGEVRDHGFSEARNSYTRSYGSNELDAAVLVLPLLGIEELDSPRVRDTIAAIQSDLDAGGPLLYRYPPGHDGLPGREGAFLPCSFWLVQALAKTGRVAEATARFSSLVQLATPLGLYAEEMDPISLEHLGNFPQALTHAAVVQAALALRDVQVTETDHKSEPPGRQSDPARDTLANTRNIQQSRRTSMTIQLGDTAPDFTAETTEGRLSLHEYLGDSWGILFSHPADFTPVCTTELGEFARRKDDFTKRNTKLIGVSVDSVESHRGWSADIAETQGQGLNYPLVGDEDRSVANLYGMIHPNAIATATVRTVFVIGPDKTVKLTLTYPAAIGRNVDEIVRVLDALQLSSQYAVSTPVNWKDGDDVIISPAISDEDAKEKFPLGFTTLKPYLRLTPQPGK